jgi:4-hydroxy-tetrahydrodipicolinate reductase
MLKILLSGCSGKMGKVIANMVTTSDACEIVAGIDIAKYDATFPIYNAPFDFSGKADVIIDFSHPACLTKLLDYAKSTKTPIVVATTGLSSSQIEELKETSKTVAVFFSANMSLGVNLIIELVKKSAALLGDGFDIEIIEKHHNQKIDAPSGTALMIADELSASLPYKSNYVYDRHNQRKKREKKEIGIHAVRGGTIVGEHEVIFAGTDEIISISHSAMSKEIFATGAIKAAKYLSNKQKGLYNMSNMISEQ